MEIILLFIDYLIHSIKWINLLILLPSPFVFLISLKLFKWFSFKSIKPKKEIYLFTGKPGSGMSRDVILPNQSEDKVE